MSHPPHAASLLESMRSIGYTLESAIADLIDNSLSAKAKNIRIEFRAHDAPYVAIIDDGLGMSFEALIEAMRHGSTNPLLARESGDMGRYGLGLKTASLSQCRRLTVISKRNEGLSGCCWDLDTIAVKGEWLLLALEETDFPKIPHISELQSQAHGTIVLWQSLDKLAAGEKDVKVALSQKMSYVRNHISLVFHRFLAREEKNLAVSICMNGAKLNGIDPFLTSHKSTQRLEDEFFNVEGEKVSVKPFILPHISKLSSEELSSAGGSDGFRSQQGFYIYRSRRLIIWGTWFRLARKEELSKLARVRVDIPNSLDHLWTLDVKKSAAHPPEVVRANLRRTLDRIRAVSGKTITFRGRKVESFDLTPIWNEVVARDGVRFDINLEHPLIRNALDDCDVDTSRKLKAMLGAIEASFPAEALYSRMASDLKSNFNSLERDLNLEALAEQLFRSLPINSAPRNMLVKCLHQIEPFNLRPDIAKKIAEEYK